MTYPPTRNTFPVFWPSQGRPYQLPLMFPDRSFDRPAGCLGICLGACSEDSPCPFLGCQANASNFEANPSGDHPTYQ